MNDRSIILSVVIPARNEEGCIQPTIDDIIKELNHRDWAYEIIVVNDHSTDKTRLAAELAGATVIDNWRDPGYGNAVKTGLEVVKGDYAVVMVADGSDSAEDLGFMLERVPSGYRPMRAVFSERFVSGSKVTGYPIIKRIANRLGNYVTAFWLGKRYADYTNPFRIIPTVYLRRILPQCRATDFSLGFEICVRYILAGYPFVVTRVNWAQRSVGTSKFKVKHAVGYLRTLVNVWRSAT